MKEYDLNVLKEALRNSSEVAAAYLFGSAAVNAPVDNDLDILLLVYPDIGSSDLAG